ncbi:MAG: M28 family peptidase [Acidobacteriota bacterium]|nr:M28 family peptidase [Acidobacteriota bacterium]
MTHKATALLVLLLTPFATQAQQRATKPQAVWKVHPQWVKAHEDFLASDLLQGRGSATRDEGMAAIYVGSEFESYGLKPAPGINGFIQTIEVEKPELDGHATVSADGLSAPLEEGPDFYILWTPGETVSGPLKRIAGTHPESASVEPGSATLVVAAGAAAPTVGQVFSLSQRSAKLLLLAENPALKQSFQQSFGGTTFVAVRPKGSSAEKTSAIVLTGGADSRIAKLTDGTQITLTLKAQQAARRFTYNTVGILPGISPTAGTLLITAHLDHLGIGKPVNGDAIYNGADDDASGTTAVLELAHALASGPRLQRSILFVCFGSEEQGDVGSSYFRDHPPVPLKDIAANIEFEMIGAQDPKMPKGSMMFTGWERTNLGPALKRHGALIGPDIYPEQHFFQRSDNYALALKGVVAQTVGGWAMPPYYHQPNDDLQHLDIKFMTNAIQSMVEPLRWLANTSFKPAWKPGGQPK